MEIRPIDANTLADDFLQDSKDAGFYRSIYVGAARRVQAAPTLDYAPVRHGEWIEGLKCSNCGQVDMTKPNFCPNCGAKMDGGKKDG